MTIKYYLRSIEGKNKSKIYCQIIYNRKKAELSTGITSTAANWDDRKEEIKGNSFLNQKLSELRMKIYKAKNSLDESGRNYSVRDIKNLVVGPKKKKVYFFTLRILSNKELKMSLGQQQHASSILLHIAIWMTFYINVKKNPCC